MQEAGWVRSAAGPGEPTAPHAIPVPVCRGKQSIRGGSDGQGMV